MTATALVRALDALSSFEPEAQIAEAASRLTGRAGGPLAGFAVGSEEEPSPERLDGSLLEAICARALEGARGAVFTPPPEARLLAAFGLAFAAARRGGPPPAQGAAALLAARPDPALCQALEGLRVLDPSCGGGALLSAAARLARGVGALDGLVLLGLDVAPLAVAAARARLELQGFSADIRRANALSIRWEPTSLLLSNPPFVRHEKIPAAEKARAAEKSGLSRQADLSAHLASLSLRRAPVAALVWPLALDTSRSAAPLLAEAHARGAFALRLRSRAAGSFQASVDTRLAVWVAGATEDAPALEATVPLSELTDLEIVSLLGGSGSARVRPMKARATPRGAVPLRDVSRVRFGLKSGCNHFFHLLPLKGGQFESPLLGKVRLPPEDTVPLLSSLREARAPALAEPGRVLFRPSGKEGLSGRYLARGERARVHLRPTCAGRNPWWQIAPERGPAPVLYPAKIGARAFAFENAALLYEDKKWHAIFPTALPAWQIAAFLSSTPVRLAIEEGARQLTGAQAIADVDCRVLSASPVPRPEAAAAIERDLRAVWDALREDPVTTDLASALRRPAQRELDLLTGAAMGLSSREIEERRRALFEHVRDRLAHAAAIRKSAAGNE